MANSEEGAMGLNIPAAQIETRARDYLIDGRSYRRVSSVLGIINKPALVPWAAKQASEALVETLRDPHTRAGLADIVMSMGEHVEGPQYDGWVDRLADTVKRAADVKRDAAAKRGTDIHADVCYTIATRSTPETLEVQQALAFIKNHNYTVEATEVTVWSELLGIAGTIDVVAREPEGNLVIWDWKSGSGPWPEMALQLGAYAMLLEPSHQVDEAFIVKLSPEGAVKHTPDDLPEAMSAFLRAYELQDGLKKVAWH